MNQQNNPSTGIKPDELKEFNLAVKRQGFQESDFHVRELSENKDTHQKDAFQKDASSKGVSQMENHPAQNNSQKCCKVAVKNQKTGKEKIYQASEEHHWVKDFENDLKNQYFK